MREDFKQRHKDNLMREVTSLGGYVIYFLALIFLLIVGNFAAARKFFLGLISIYLVTILIRFFYFKDRPNKYNYDNILERLDASSFPSLHAARSAFLFLGLSRMMNSAMFSLLVILIVVAVCYSRIYLQKHDLKDVSAGVVLGLVVYFVV